MIFLNLPKSEYFFIIWKVLKINFYQFLFFIKFTTILIVILLFYQFYLKKMPISLQRKSASTLSVIPANKSFRVSRLKTDLDHSFIEASTQTNSAQTQLPYIDLYGFPIDTAYLTMIDKETTKRVQMGIFVLNNKEIHFATPSPNCPGQREILESFVQKGYTFKLYLCSPLSLDKLIKTYDAVVQNNIVSDEINLDSAKIAQKSKSIGNFAELSQSLQRVSVSEVIETVLVSALENKASDIHFEPEKLDYHIRLRLDGVLHNLEIGRAHV